MADGDLVRQLALELDKRARICSRITLGHREDQGKSLEQFIRESLDALGAEIKETDQS